MALRGSTSGTPSTMRFPQGYRRWRGSFEVPLVRRTSRYVPSRAAKQEVGKSAVRRLRTITATIVASPTATMQPTPTWASAINQARPSFIAPVIDRVATALCEAATARGNPPQPLQLVTNISKQRGFETSETPQHNERDDAPLC
jgi:hypothetical protein